MEFVDFPRLLYLARVAAPFAILLAAAVAAPFFSRSMYDVREWIVCDANARYRAANGEGYRKNVLRRLGKVLARLSRYETATYVLPRLEKFRDIAQIGFLGCFGAAGFLLLFAGRPAISAPLATTRFGAAAVLVCAGLASVLASRRVAPAIKLIYCVDWKAELLGMEGRRDEEIVERRRLCRLCPDDYHYARALSLSLEKGGELEEARGVMLAAGNKTGADAGDAAYLVWSFSVCLDDRKHADAAIRRMEEAEAAQGWDTPLVLLCKAVVFLMRGEDEEAKTVLEQALKRFGTTCCFELMDRSKAFDETKRFSWRLLGSGEIVLDE